MDDAITAWSGDWRSRLSERLRSSGFADLRDLLKKYPSDTYQQLARRIGTNPDTGVLDIAPIQIQLVQFEDPAALLSCHRAFARDALVRFLRQHLPRGWNATKRADFQRAGAKVDWINLVSDAQKNADLRERAEEVWECLVGALPSDDWLPQSSDDPLIEAAFNRGWHIPRATKSPKE